MAQRVTPLSSSCWRVEYRHPRWIDDAVGIPYHCLVLALEHWKPSIDYDRGWMVLERAVKMKMEKRWICWRIVRSEMLRISKSDEEHGHTILFTRWLPWSLWCIPWRWSYQGMSIDRNSADKIENVRWLEMVRHDYRIQSFKDRIARDTKKIRLPFKEEAAGKAATMNGLGEMPRFN